MSYIHFIGIDVSKDVFDAACHDTQHRAQQFPNTPAGFKAFAKAFADLLPTALVVLEATGGYESALLGFLAAKGIAAHRAHPLQAKHFIRSLGNKGKTDKLDAAALARYGAERQQNMALWTPPSPEQQQLASLHARRSDLVIMRVAEQNRLAHPAYRTVAPSVKAMIRAITTEINAIEAKIEAVIKSSAALAQKLAIMTSVKGIGRQTAYTLLATMPELGSMNRKQAASLAGLAPHPKDSGTISRYRPTSGGRQTVRKALFMAALSAIRSHPTLEPFYNTLVKNGKKPMVAIVAVMRKLITIINGKIRDELLSPQPL